MRLLFSILFLSIVFNCKALTPNLENNDFPQRQELSELSQQTAEDAKDKGDSYSLSVPLLATSLLGQKDAYSNLHDLMITALLVDTEHSSDFKAWLWGRVLVAGYHMSMKQHEEEAYQQMEMLLLDNINSPFTAWAYGYKAIYEATIKSPQYKDSLMQGLQIADTLKEPEKEGDWLWAQVMLMTATAYQKDQESFDHIVNNIKVRTGTDDIVQALSHIPEDDWRAWALALVDFSYTQMGQNHENLAKAAKSNANTSKSDGNKLLSLLTLEWSEINSH